MNQALINLLCQNRNEMRRLYITGLLFIISIAAFSQTGKITGKVINAGSGQGMVSATVFLIEQSKTEVADQNGNFTFGKLAAGTYSIKCSYGGYNEKIIDEILVKDNEVTAVTISLEEKSLQGVVLTSRKSARVESVASLLSVQKNYAGVSDGITADIIRKTPDRGSSDVIKRVSGASIQDDRFAIIRGLNDRYNAAFINGAPLPSTESDRKAFAFDIFPAAILENLIIYKTATPDKSGDFAGGIIDITTKSTLPKNFTSISYSIGFNTQITGKTRYFSDNRGKKDWIGLDDGTRGLPAGIPSAETVRGLTPAQGGELAKLFGNYRWGIQKRNARPDFNFQIAKGFNIQRKQKEFIGALFSINYRRGFTLNDAPERNVISPRGLYLDSVYNDEVVLAALGNFSLKINSRNNISWKNNLSINTDNKLIKRSGVPDQDSDPDTYLRDVVRWYTSNQIFSSQLTGEHQVGKIKTKINWLGSFSSVKREIPEFSRTSYRGNITSPGQAFVNNNPTQLSGSGTMFFANTDEDIKSIKADISQPYTFMKNSQNLLKAGGGYQLRKRDFTSRLLGFAPYDIGAVQHDFTLNELPEDQIFLPQHLGILKNGKGGFLLRDGTTGNSDYDASSSTAHAYIMNDQRFFKKFRLVYGVRMERFNQKLNSPSDNGLPPLSIDSVVTDFLPSANFVYALTPKMNLRLSYAETVNRPEFRELAPFLFYDYQAQYSINGDLRLQRAKIKNYDFRYEFFPGKAQLFSVSAFYKEFENPIEIIFIPGIGLGGTQATYANSPSAEVYGAEVEFRTLLSTLVGMKKDNSILSKLTLSANGAYIYSNVKLPFVSGTGSVSRIATDRPMQGQSPYLINGSLAYSDEKTGLSSTLSVNRVGDRLSVAGVKDEVFDIYEKARTVIDFQLAKIFMNNMLELKFNAKDLLAQNISFYYDNDVDKSYSEGDIYLSTYKTPKVFTFSVTLKF